MQIQLEWKDYLKANYMNSIFTTASKPFLIYSILLLLDGLAFSCVLVFSPVKVLLIFPILLIIFGAVNIVSILFWLPRKTKKLFNQHKEIHGPIKIEVEEIGLRETTTNSETLYPWENFYQWREDEDLLMLYISAVLFIIIPKRFSEDQVEIEQIKQYLKESNVEQHKRNRKDMNRQYKISAIIMSILFVYVCVAQILIFSKAIFV